MSPTNEKETAPKARATITAPPSTSSSSSPHKHQPTKIRKKTENAGMAWMGLSEEERHGAAALLGAGKNGMFVMVM